MEKYYTFAGISIAAVIPDDRTYTQERNLSAFAVDSAVDPHYFRFEIVDALTPPAGDCLIVQPNLRVYGDDVRFIGSVQHSWENAYMRVEHQDREHRVQLLARQFPERIGAKTLLNCISAEHLAVDADGFVFHASFIGLQGEAVLFTAPSGVGKSTQAGLWERHRGAEIINGDRAAVRVTQDGVIACGVPFAGSSGICKNQTLPLKAIIYLKQADVTAIRRLRGAEAFHRIWEGCSVNIWNQRDVARISEMVQQVLLSVPVYELACTPDETAVEALEGVLME